MKKLKDYFPEFVLNFLAIFLGVLATLYLTGKISENDERKNLRLQLDAVKIELNENIKSIDSVLNYIEREDSLRKYVRSINNPKQLNEDSLKKYYTIVPTIRVFTYKNDALEMLKYTGSLRLISDKQLLLNIITCYSDLEVIKSEYDVILNQKLTLLNQTLETNFNLVFIDLRKPVYIGLYNYFHNNPGIKPDIEKCKKHIEKTLEKL